MTYVLDMSEEDAPVRQTLPEGTHEVHIEKAEFKNSNSGGRYLNIECDIEYNGFTYKFWERFNVINASPNAEKTGRTRLKEFVFACLGNDPEENLTEDAIVKTVENRHIIALIKHKPGFPDTSKTTYYPENFWTWKKENRLGKKFPTTSGEDLPF